MEEYRKLVENAFLNKSEFLIPNSSKAHAKIIVNELINSAKNNVCIYTSGNDIDFYSDEKIKNTIAAKRDVSFVVILDNDGDAYKAIFPQGTAFYSIKETEKFIAIAMPPSLQSREKNFDLMKHFMVVDSISFRVEKPHSERDESVTAVACANDKETAESMTKIFNLLRSNFCKQINN